MLKSSIMKIDRRGFLGAASSALMLIKSQLSAAAHPQPSEIAEPLAGEEKAVAVYTTAANSDFRLSATDTLAFKPMGQPPETQVRVFFDPLTPFQPQLYNGGALT